MTPLVLFFHLFQLGRGSLASWDEAIYASIARTVFRTGDWLCLRDMGFVWLEKPPLAIWATAGFYHWLGVSEFTARLFSAVCGIALVYLTYFIGRQLINRYVGLIGALTLLSSSYYLRFTRFGMTDIPVVFFMALTLYLFWLGQQRNRFLVLSGVALGLALMTKGFTVLMILPVCWIYCVWTRRTEILRRPAYWVGLALALAILLPWLVYQVAYFREQLWQQLVVRQFILRVNGVLDGHSGNWYFYIRALINKYHPWILIGVFSAPFFLIKSIRTRENEIVFLTIWMFFIFVCVTAVQTKLHWYILPVYPPLSISVGYVIALILGEKHARWVRLIFIAALALHIPLSHVLSADYSADIKGIAPLVKREVPAGGQLYLYQYHEIPACDFYIERKYAYLENAEEFIIKAKDKGFNCLIHRDRLEPILTQAPWIKKNIKGSFDKLLFVSTAP
ncbi:MAG: glycosyltransferase family 39 protein [Candidatus Omnitrophota bacterium]